MRRPDLDEGLVTHIERSAVDPPWPSTSGMATSQHCSRPGGTSSRSHPLTLPDAVFVEDTVVVFRNVAVMTRPGAPSRRGEVEEVEKVIDALGLSVAHITAPATLDGATS